jgi:hypothetical protein
VVDIIIVRKEKRRNEVGQDKGRRRRRRGRGRNPRERSKEGKKERPKMEHTCRKYGTGKERNVNRGNAGSCGKAVVRGS